MSKYRITWRYSRDSYDTMSKVYYADNAEEARRAFISEHYGEYYDILEVFWLYDC